MAMAARQRLVASLLRGSAVNSGSQNISRRFYHVDAEELHHNIDEMCKWRRITFAMVGLCLAYGAYTFSHPEEHHGERKMMPYMNIRKKDFPWGPDPLFDSFKKKH